MYSEKEGEILGGSHRCLKGGGYILGGRGGSWECYT